jgi:pyruvate/2-oxoacid:ferredoxin oxidoreductase beta subunit
MENQVELLAPGHSMCAGCGVGIAINQISRACPRDVIISCATSCLEVTTSPYPITAWNVPWIHAAFETSSSVASGIEAAVKRLGKKWKVIAIAGDGGTYDIGIQAISGTLERGQKVTHICVDNEAYMNCLSLDSLIMTCDGLKRITDLRLGERVYAFDQKTHKLVMKRCTGIFDNGVKDVYELETHHNSIKATANHPFLTLKRNGRGRTNGFVWKTLSEIRAGDEIISLKSLDESKPFRFNTKRVKVGDYKVTHLNEIDLPELSDPKVMKYLGIWVGDGWTRPMRGEVGFALPEGTEARDAILDLNSEIFSADARVDDQYIYVNSVNLARFISSLGFGSGARNKVLPPWVFTLTREEKDAFVQGLMLSDGYQINGSHRYVSASNNLLRTLRLFLQTAGWRVGKIHHQRKERGTRVVYRDLLKDSEYGYVCFSRRGKWNMEKYPSQYKYQNFLVDNEHFEMQKVIGIRPVGKEPTLDLRVEGAHNFVADGVVVHNTGIQRSGSTPYAAWTTTSPNGKESYGKTEWKKPIIDIIKAHRVPYVASASVAYPMDLQKKVKKALDKQPSFILVHCPCPAGWKIDPSQSINVAKRAIETGVWLLYEIEDGRLTMNMKIPKRKPVGEYFKLQGRFKHLQKKEIDDIQKHIDLKWKEFEETEKTGMKFLY